VQLPGIGTLQVVRVMTHRETINGKPVIVEGKNTVQLLPDGGLLAAANGPGARPVQEVLTNDYFYQDQPYGGAAPQPPPPPAPRPRPPRPRPPTPHRAAAAGRAPPAAAAPPRRPRRGRPPGRRPPPPRQARASTTVVLALAWRGGRTRALRPPAFYARR